MDNIYIVIIAIVAVIIIACVREVMRLRTFLRNEKEKRLQEHAEKSRLTADVILTDFDCERQYIFTLSPEYDKIKNEEKEIRDQLLKEVLNKVYEEEQRTKKRLEQEAVLEIIHDVIRNFRHSVYQRMNQPKLKEAKAKKKLIFKNRISQEREKRNNREQEKEKLRQEEQKLQEQEKQRQDEERQRQDEERRQKDEEKMQKEQQDKEQRQQQESRQKIMEKRGVDSFESRAAKASEMHISEIEIKPEGISVTKVVSEAGKTAGKVASKASGGR